MPLKNLDDAIAAVRSGMLQELLGLPECEWLDAKDGVYVLDDPAKSEELVKDVAAFANARTGGMVVIGFSTRTEHGQEFLEQLRPVPRALVDLDRHRKLIRERIIPQPRDVTVDWIDVSSGKGVLAIHIPPQPPAARPFVVPGPTRTAVVSDISIAVPVREADASAWLPRSEIQRILAAGWTATGGPTEEFLSNLIRQSVAAAAAAPRRSAPAPAFTIGEGAPAEARQLQAAVAILSGHALIGDPTGVVYAEGPGIVQHLHGAAVGGDGWLLCLLPAGKPVLVAESVWESLRYAGSGAIEGEALAATGFPVLSTANAGTGRLVTANATSVSLAGGTWGPGRLLRDNSSADWRWEPDTSLALEMTRGGRSWTARPPDPDLRVRVTVMPSWSRSNHAVTGAALRRLAADLPASAFAAAIEALAFRRGSGSAGLALGRWHDGQTGRGVDRGSLAGSITTQGGTETMTAEVFLATINAEVVTIAELRMEGPADWQPVDNPEIRLSMTDLLGLLTAAWQMSADVLPSFIEGSDTALPAGPPVVELHMAANRGRERGVSDLRDMVDFSPFGVSDRSQIPEMLVTITGPLRRSPEDRLLQARRALAYMGQAYGFTDASEDW